MSNAAQALAVIPSPFLVPPIMKRRLARLNAKFNAMAKGLLEDVAASL
jgi:hypothetical protein